MTVLTAIYRALYKTVRIDFMEDGTMEYTAVGDVTDAEISTLARTQGGNVAGWSCELQ